MMKIAVVGAGIIGLTTAITLKTSPLADNITVDLFAEDFSPNTTSDVAGALWLPYLAEPLHDVFKWSKITYEKFEQEIENKTPGVYMKSGKLFWHRDEINEENDYYFAKITKNFRFLNADEIPKNTGLKKGMYMRAPVVQMTEYLKSLTERAVAMGVRIFQRRFESIADPFLTNNYKFVINCSGLGARILANDPSVFPVRGQVLYTKPIQGINEFYCIEDNDGTQEGILTYVFPHQNYILIGGSSSQNNYDMSINADETKHIIAKIRKYFIPNFDETFIMKTKVHLRPCRKGGIRVEKDNLMGNNNSIIIHNYGHGGSGMTLCWGCADSVLHIVNSSLSHITSKL